MIAAHLPSFDPPAGPTSRPFSAGGIPGAVTPLDQTAEMAFAQASGPPASARQVERLLALLRAEGHADFRDARGPMGFSQRQAGGRFTRDEAAAYIDQLEADDGAERPAPAGAATAVARPTGSSAAERAAAGLASEVLAAELQRRGWMAIEPLEGS